MAKQPYKGQFGNMEFPEYQFREYPKMVLTRAGKEVVVNNHAEELRLVDDIVLGKDVAKIEQERDAVATALLEKEKEIQAHAKEIEELKKKLEEAQKPKVSVVNPPAAVTSPYTAS